MQHAEARGGADVHRDAIRVDRAFSANDLADARHRLIPGGALELVTAPEQRKLEAVGGRVGLVLLEPLDAGVPAGDHVVAVGAEGEEAVALELGLEAAEGLADAAEGRLGAGHLPGLARGRATWANGSCARRLASSGKRATFPRR